MSNLQLLLNEISFTTDQFTFIKENKCLCVEASSLGMLFPSYHLIIKSAHTGKVFTFRNNEILHDPDGDVIQWEFVPDEPIKNVKRVIIFND